MVIVHKPFQFIMNDVIKGGYRSSYGFVFPNEEIAHLIVGFVLFL